jgi:DnaJ-class molecular chaperone
MDGYTYLNEEQMKIRDKVHLILTNFELYFPSELEKTEIRRCVTCEGSGLPCKKGSELTLWQPGTCCKDCGGFGYRFREMGMQYVCQKCKGSGCGRCKGSGFVDWISNAMGVK